MKEICKMAIAQAKKELKEEKFRDDVEIAKEKLRLKKSIWERLIPFKIVRRS